MAKRNRVIGYVVVDRADGDVHVEGCGLHEHQGEADRSAKALNTRHNTTRFASKALLAD